MKHVAKAIMLFVFSKRFLPFLVSVPLLFFLVLGSFSDSKSDAYQKMVGKKGFFRLAAVDGIWWFITPEDNQFVSLGMNHIEPVLLCSEKNRELFMKKYGDDLIGPAGRPNNRGDAAKRWLEDSIKQIKQWGFNSLGMHNPVSQTKMPYVAKFRVAAIDGAMGPGKKYKDPFDPKTEAFIDQFAQKWSDKYKNDKMILGISFNDMPTWRSSPGRIHGWVKFCMELSADSPGKQKWVAVLRENYPGVSTAAAVYGIEASSWDDFLERTAWPASPQPEKVVKDVRTFLPLIADHWYGIVSDSIRKYDQNHLILGDKFIGNKDLPNWLDPILKKHFDVVYIQWYDYAHNQIPRLKELYMHTGKPILMGDSSFSCPNRNVPNPKGVRVSSQREVGEAYYTYLQSIMTEPYIVGWHYCGFIEGSPDLTRFHRFFSIQNGFLQPDGTPYKEAIDRVTEANLKANSWHEEAKPIVRSSEKLTISPNVNLTLAGPVVDVFAQETSEKKRCVTSARDNCVLSKIDDNVYNAGSFKGIGSVPKKNVSWVVTAEGVVVIDPGVARTASVAKEIIRETTDKPIKYIIYTHHHGTQVMGASLMKDPETKIIAHEDLVAEFDLLNKFYQYNARLNSIQFNFRMRDNIKPTKFVYPDITYQTQYKFELGKTKFELYHAVGESSDYTVVFLPDQRIVWVADLIVGGMPLVASPMKRVRDEVKWRKALELVKGLRSEVMIQSRHLPLCNQALIASKLDVFIDFFNFLHDSVAREMNAGSSLEETLNNIQLPLHLKNTNLLQEKYGNLQFNVRGLYQRYSGWFDQNGTHLNPAPAKITAKSFIDAMGGVPVVLEKARVLTKEGNVKLALEYLDLVIDAGTQLKEAHQLKGEVLMEMSKQYNHRMTTNMYRRLGQMELDKVKQLSE
jgi:glyoxylase-like metal-dependent hydrolase (beta-lactamase superfamily II)